MKFAQDFQAAVIGGDSRQIVVASALTALFKKVKLYGHPVEEIPEPLVNGSNLTDALDNTKVILLPLSGMNDAGMIRSYGDKPLIDFGSQVALLPKGTIIVTGSVTPKWLALTEKMNLQVLQYAENDEIAILNSIPTAEGVLQIALEQLPITIHGCTTVVIGFGRVGITVARVFKALGAKVLVVARRPGLLVRAVEMGCEAFRHEELGLIVRTADLIINTVPAMVIDETILHQTVKTALIIDLASAPGGTDFKSAAEIGIRAMLAPGLPGIVAPKTAGEILAATIPKLILDLMNQGGGIE